MALLNQKGFERKLQQMSSAQDSVQTVSLWIIHHKKYADDIVKVWMEQLKRCKAWNRILFLVTWSEVAELCGDVLIVPSYVWSICCVYVFQVIPIAGLSCYI